MTTLPLSCAQRCGGRCQMRCPDLKPLPPQPKSTGSWLKTACLLSPYYAFGVFMGWVVA